MALVVGLSVILFVGLSVTWVVCWTEAAETIEITFWKPVHMSKYYWWLSCLPQGNPCGIPR